MHDDIRLLEQRVQSAVERLRRLQDERARLRDEVRTLSDRLERESAVTAPLDERAHVIAEIRQALEELRGD
jgi:hypothetical protein